jgi:hypothetical protein
MKLKILSSALLLTSLFLATPTRAENPEHVRQLLKTKECQDCDLSGADLSGADLTFAILVGADLRGANLRGANLSHADLTRANLNRTDFSQANLNQAYLNHANLEQTSLVSASLNGTRGLPIMNPPLARLYKLPPISPLPPRAFLYPLPPLPSPINRQPSTLQRSQLQRLRVAPQLTAPLPVTSLEPRTLPSAPIPSNTAQVPPPIQPTQGTDTTSQPTANVYPPEMVEAFMSTCAKQGNVGGVSMQPICACSIKKIQNQYTLSEFMSIAAQMAETKKPREQIVQIAVECAFENLSGR